MQIVGGGVFFLCEHTCTSGDWSYSHRELRQFAFKRRATSVRLLLCRTPKQRGAKILNMRGVCRVNTAALCEE